MIVTGAFFADEVQDVGARMSVVGGVWDYVNVPADAEGIAPRLVILAQTSPDDYGSESVITITTLDPSGVQIAQADMHIEDLGAFAENRYFHLNVPFKTRARGRYSFHISADGAHPLALGLDVRPAQ